MFTWVIWYLVFLRSVVWAATPLGRLDRYPGPHGYEKCVKYLACRPTLYCDDELTCQTYSAEAKKELLVNFFNLKK